ncbi:dihydrofolate reductase family protein [Chitinophaga sp. HK235]|uniref:dihydrofolate reductase family protein n=1 Tax=Chitinophaga sp. HK235 TaxID=2952571 RepID=UPI002012CC97|nr:dihydrofolate reductase family protein [Chitinophaga sp. HK235]
MKENLQRIVGILKAPCQGPEKNILVYGSGRLVGALIQEELVDEYQLWVHPVVLGKGVPLFRNEQMRVMLEFQQMQTLKSGVIWFRFFVNKNLSPAGG